MSASSYKAQVINTLADKLVEMIERFMETGKHSQWDSFMQTLNVGLEALDKGIEELRELDRQAPSTVPIASKKFHLLQCTLMCASMRVAKADPGQDVHRASVRCQMIVEDVREATGKASALHDNASLYEEMKTLMAEEQNLKDSRKRKRTD